MTGLRQQLISPGIEYPTVTHFPPQSPSTLTQRTCSLWPFTPQVSICRGRRWWEWSSNSWSHHADGPSGTCYRPVSRVVVGGDRQTEREGVLKAHLTEHEAIYLPKHCLWHIMWGKSESWQWDGTFIKQCNMYVYTETLFHKPTVANMVVFRRSPCITLLLPTVDMIMTCCHFLISTEHKVQDE